jgi:hypothetical protein
MVCYAPSTGTLAVIGVGIYVLWHKTIGHFFGMFGTVLEIALILSVEVAAAIALVWLTRQIRRRRAAAGACTTCRFRCQQALAARPNLLVNVVDRRVPAPERRVLTCHPAAPLLPARIRTASAPLPAGLAAAGRRLRPALQFSRPATGAPATVTAAPATAATAPDPAPRAVAAASRAQLPRGHGAARFMGPVPAPFSVRGPVHAPVSPLPPSATRVSSPTPAPEPEAVAVDGYVLTPDGVDAAGSPSVTLPH